MIYNIDGKIILVTGGASGIGLCYAKELLRNGAQGVTLADTNAIIGNTALVEIEREFGVNRAIFVKTDVTISEQLRNAFEKTIEKFKHIDIVINNAGILNDAIWEQQINININGVIHSTLLAIEEYFPKYKQEQEAVIVNIASTASFDFYSHCPIYSATKAAVASLTKSWGKPEIYNKLKVRFLAICPGVTATPLIFDMHGRNLGPIYEDILRNTLDKGVYPSQEPDHVAKELVRVVQHAPNGSLWVVEAGDPCYEYDYPERFLQKKNILKTE